MTIACLLSVNWGLLSLERRHWVLKDSSSMSWLLNYWWTPVVINMIFFLKIHFSIVRFWFIEFILLVIWLPSREVQLLRFTDNSLTFTKLIVLLIILVISRNRELIHAVYPILFINWILSRHLLLLIRFLFKNFLIEIPAFKILQGLWIFASPHLRFGMLRSGWHCWLILPDFAGTDSIVLSHS